MNKNTRTMRTVSMLALLGVAVMISMLYSPTASAANGQCKWEGGPGKATYPYCEAEDCIGNGGTAMCSAGIGADISGGPDEDELGPDKWVFHGCDNQAPQAAWWALWCTSAGGTWVTPGATCTNLPAGVVGGGGSMTNNEPQIMATAEDFADGGSCGRVVTSDTGWGATFTSTQCWPGSVSTNLGIVTSSGRKKLYEGQSCGGLNMIFLKNRAAKCPPGYKSRNAVSIGEECYIPGECCLKVGNPVSPFSGTKYNEETDYIGPAQSGLELRRYFKSTGYYRPRGITTTAPNPDDTHFSEFWRTTYDQRLYAVTGNTEVIAIQQRADGGVRAFDVEGKEVGNIDGGAAFLTVLSGTGWDLRLENHDVERYDTAGRLISITARSGLVTTLTYDTCDLLSTVTGAFGHVLTFTNDCSKKRATAVTLPDSSQILYGYDQWDRPAVVTYPDSTTRTYSYADARHQWLLTAIQDESGQNFATYTYDSSGRVISTEHAARAGYYVFTYSSNNTTTVVDPLGATTQYGFSSSGGAMRKASHSMACRDCGNVASRTYDTKGNPSLETNFNGIQTQFAFDAVRNLETSRTEAYGTARARTITTTWHSTFRQPTQIERPGQRTNFTHDSNGNVLTKTITDLVTSATRTWAYTYDSYGRVLTENGPRTDVSDVTTYTYYTCTSGNECGELQTIQNALGRTTTFNTYNAHGQPLTITDANGVVTTLAYDVRQRLTGRTTGGEQTAFEYWPTGLLKKTMLPDGGFVQYTYDAAHRLTRVDDSAGNYMRYVLDSAGNRTDESAYDPSGALSRKQKQVFNSLSRLWKQMGAAGTAAVTTTFTYDNSGNQTNVSAPLGRSTANLYDELDRLKHITDAASGVTQFAYDALDNLTSVTDPRGKVTSYQYNGFGEMTQLTSPDTGVSVSTYDSAGNLATSTDARSKTGTYTYDALNRVTSITYPDQTTSFTYDSGANGMGRLTGASDADHSIAWSYDTLGRVTNKTQVVSSVSKSVGYGYSAGQRTSMTLPSGRVVTYGYANNHIASISVDGVEVLHDVEYAPFGPVAGWTWGNGSTTTRAYNLDGNSTSIESAGSNTYTYDNALRITAITDPGNSARSWTYGYDAVDRLTSASRTSLSQSWTYDANGNRLTEGGTSSSTYTVSSTSNRLASVSGALSRTYTHADSGQVTSYSGLSFTYNDAGRLTGLTGSATATYVINALGQRVKKTTGGVTTYFLYDDEGHLVGEYDGTGALVQEIVWLGDIPVATLRDCSCGDAIFYIHTDHLNTPRRITKRSTTDIVWRWDSDPFGTTPANEDPDGDSTAFIFNLRFPGQYFDVESGLNYNHRRDYDPRTGVYVQSDPIGLGGGLNTYSYVLGSPLQFADPLGLLIWQNYTAYGTLKSGVYRTFPDSPPSDVGGGVGGITFVHWNIRSICKPQCDGSVKFEQFDVEFVANVRVKAGFAPQVNAWAVRAELDHVADFYAWANSQGKRIAQEREDRYKNIKYSSIAECVEATSGSLSRALSSSILRTALETAAKWDHSGKHDYTGPDRRP